MQTLRDTWLIFRRSVVLTLRQPVWLLMGILQPILYLVLFGPLLEGAVTQSGAGVNAFDWFVPGMLVMVAVFGAAFVGFGLIAELRYGVIERRRVTPMSRFALLLGRSLRDAVLLLMQAVIMIVIAIPFGITLDPAGLLVTLALCGLIGLAMAPLSYSAALVLKSEDAFAPMVQFVALPLLLLSGIFLPLQLAPSWLQTLSDLNPVSYAVDAVRAAFNGQWGDPAIAIGSTIIVVIAVAAVWLASRAFSRATS
jgi:ABC-2 type transport system permease protein